MNLVDAERIRLRAEVMGRDALVDSIELLRGELTENKSEHWQLFTSFDIKGPTSGQNAFSVVTVHSCGGWSFTDQSSDWCGSPFFIQVNTYTRIPFSDKTTVRFTRFLNLMAAAAPGIVYDFNVDTSHRRQRFTVPAQSMSDQKSLSSTYALLLLLRGVRFKDVTLPPWPRI